MSQEFRFRNTDETGNYLLKETKKYEIMCIKHEKVCTTLNYIKHFFISASTITGCISISDFLSLIGIPIEIKSSAIGLKVCAITAENEKYKSKTKKKKKKHDKIVFLAKSKSNMIEVLISEALADLKTSHFNFFLINNVLKEYDVMKEEINQKFNHLKSLLKILVYL